MKRSFTIFCKHNVPDLLQQRWEREKGQWTEGHTESREDIFKTENRRAGYMLTKCWSKDGKVTMPERRG